MGFIFGIIAAISIVMSYVGHMKILYIAITALLWTVTGYESENAEYLSSYKESTALSVLLLLVVLHDEFVSVSRPWTVEFIIKYCVVLLYVLLRTLGLAERAFMARVRCKHD